MKTINNDLIRSFNPCYDPSKKKIPDGETLSVLDWVEKYRSVVPPQDIIWLLCRNHFLSDCDLRLFAVWCAREALSLTDSPDPRSLAACDVAERYANGEATDEELQAARDTARDAAWSAARNAAWYAARDAAWSAARNAAWYAARDAAWSAARNAAWYAARDAAYYDASEAARAAATCVARATREKQVDKLLTYFK